MLNKAIEQQAIEYKQKIMVEVAHNATMILESFNEHENQRREREIEKENPRDVREFGY